MENMEEKIIEKLGRLSLIPDKNSKASEDKPGCFETPEKNVFLVKKIDRDDLRRRMREDISDSMRDRRRDFMRSKGITYFDQKENTTKRMAIDELENPQIENGNLE